MDRASTRDLLDRGRKRRGAEFVCGLFVQLVVIGGAAFPSEMFAGDLPRAGMHHPSFGSQAPSSPAIKPMAEFPPRADRGFVPKRPRLDNPKLPAASLVADLEVPKMRPSTSLPPFAEAPLPAPPVSTEGSPQRKQVIVHVGLFGDGTETVTTKRPEEKVRTGGFRRSQGISPPSPR